MRSAINAAAENAGVAAVATGMGSIMNMHFQKEPIRRPEDIAHTPIEARSLFHLEMLARGFYLARRGLIALSIAVTDEEIEGFLGAFREFLNEYRSVLPRR
jgi:glutamate-1-semialdehyde 2,1-aminomutase